MKNEKILIFGAHPDDIEIGMGGFISSNSEKYDIIMCDLTQGEMGSNGTIEIRMDEAKKSQKVLGAIERINMKFEDRNIVVKLERIKDIADTIRKYQPKIVFAPYYKDYHPDHENCSKLIREAIHMSGLVKYSSKFKKFRPEKFIYYYINDIENANFYFDISDSFEKKIEALRCHRSQFSISENTVETYLNSNFIEKIVTRDKYYGDQCGVNYCEAFQKVGSILIKDIENL